MKYNININSLEKTLVYNNDLNRFIRLDTMPKLGLNQNEQ